MGRVGKARQGKGMMDRKTRKDQRVWNDGWIGRTWKQEISLHTVGKVSFGQHAVLVTLFFLGSLQLLLQSRSYDHCFWHSSFGILFKTYDTRVKNESIILIVLNQRTLLVIHAAKLRQKSPRTNSTKRLLDRVATIKIDRLLFDKVKPHIKPGMPLRQQRAVLTDQSSHAAHRSAPQTPMHRLLAPSRHVLVPFLTAHLESHLMHVCDTDLQAR